MTAQIFHGNNLDILPTIADCSVDSIVTDPPYELGFMGKKWDASGIAYNVTLWAECLRVLKPGGHLLAFGGTRTYHRMAVAIEDAGFEIRDSIHWIYGSGFPKSLDVSKAIDKQAGAERSRVVEYAGQTDAAKQWQGWGTALKPAHEPIVLARKPLIGTVAANVLEYGTGALNIDGCRVNVSDDDIAEMSGRSGRRTSGQVFTGKGDGQSWEPTAAGRWPANVIFDTEAGAVLDEQSGLSKSGAAGRKGSSGFAAGYDGHYDIPYGDSGGASRFFTSIDWNPEIDVPFRYVAKPSRAERNAGLDGLPEIVTNEATPPGTAGSRSPRAGANRNGAAANHHPTVKPLALMRWLIKLITPPEGTVLDPFAGSGTTLAAATLENFNSIGIELTDDYLPIIHARIAWAEQQTENEIPSLF